VTISIRDPETDRLAGQLAKLSGETITKAIGSALRERLAREQARAAGRVGRLLAIGDRCARHLPPPFSSAGNGELLYDEHGLSR
jgi:antitoxin VapB